LLNPRCRGTLSLRGPSDQSLAKQGWWEKQTFENRLPSGRKVGYGKQAKCKVLLWNIFLEPRRGLAIGQGGGNAEKVHGTLRLNKRPARKSKWAGPTRGGRHLDSEQHHRLWIVCHYNMGQRAAGTRDYGLSSKHGHDQGGIWPGKIDVAR